MPSRSRRYWPMPYAVCLVLADKPTTAHGAGFVNNRFVQINAGKHHNSALCHIATTLLTRIIACWRAAQPYQLRDVDGTAATVEQALQIIAERYAKPKTSEPSAEPLTQERTGETSGRQALHQPARPPPTLDEPAQLDVG
jgi:hypothetical protein